MGKITVQATITTIEITQMITRLNSMIKKNLMHYAITAESSNLQSVESSSFDRLAK